MTDIRVTRIKSEFATSSDEIRATRLKVETAGIQNTIDERITRISSEFPSIDENSQLRITRFAIEIATSNEATLSIDATEDGEDTANINLSATILENQLSINATEDGEDTAEIRLFVSDAGDCKKYTDLIIMQHSDKINLVSTICTLTRPLADIQVQLNKFVKSYDKDFAIGNQLDVVGKWVGIDRILEEPLEGVFFSFDDPDLGFDQGVWKGPFDASTGVTYLSDDFYRLLINAKIVNNHWKGNKNHAYEILNTVFNPLGYTFFIEDHADLSISLGLIGPEFPIKMVYALFLSGKFDVKPAGIRIKERKYQSREGKVFAFDIVSSLFDGFDKASWAKLITD